MYEGVAIEISKALDEYSEELQQKLDKVSKQVAIETAKRLKEGNGKEKSRLYRIQRDKAGPDVSSEQRT